MGLNIERLGLSEDLKTRVNSAYTTAVNGDGKNSIFIDTTNELTNFKKELFTLYVEHNLSWEDMNKLCKDAEKELKAAEKQAKKDAREQKAEENRREIQMVEEINGLIEGDRDARLKKDSSVTLDNIADKIATLYANEYEKEIQAIRDTVALIKATNFNSKDDVKKIISNVKKENKDLTDFQEGILDDLVKLAKKAQIEKETNQLIGFYEETNKDKSYSERLSDVRVRMDNEGLTDTSYYNNAYQEGVLPTAANEVISNANADRQEIIAETAEGTDYNAESIVDKLQGKYGDDDFAIDVVKDQKNLNETAARIINFNNRKVELKNITSEELKNNLGNNLVEGLELKYLPDRINDDGTYDVSNLSDIFQNRMGADYLVNTTSGEPDEMNEFKLAQDDLKIQTGLEKLSEKEVRKLMDLCKVEEAPRKHTLGGVVGDDIVVGAAAGVAGSVTLDLTQRVNLELSADIAGQIAEQARKLGSTVTTSTTSSGKVLITIAQEVFYNNAIQNLLIGTGIGALADLLIPLIIGKKQDENSCVSIADFDMTNEKYTKIDNYTEYVKEKYGEKGELLATLAKACKEEHGDEWYIHYDSLLKNYAGVGSKLNCSELNIGAALNPPEVTEKVEKTDNNISTPPVDENPIIEENDSIITTKVEPVSHKWHGESWQAVVATYYPEAAAKYEKQGLKPLVDAFRRTHGYSFKSGVPSKGELVLQPLTIDGVTYEPKEDKNGEKLKYNTSDERYGWKSTFFDPDWKDKTQGVTKVKSEGKTVYTSTRTSDGKTVKGIDEKETQNALIPEGKDNTKITVTITNADGSTRREIIEPKKKAE